jgi:hypothetical protein
MRRRAWRLLLAPAVVIAVLGQMSLASQAAVPAATTAATAVSGVAPNSTNQTDCNGWSNAYKSLKQGMRALCTDPITVKNGQASRFIDNMWYVGHDEPSVKFISTAAGSGNSMSYTMKIPADPAKTPTASGSVTKYGELSPAPWFGLPLCDPKSYPQNACTPDSDTNSGSMTNPADAGSAFMELQFYPPGFGSFVDSESCSKTQWCAALTIDSLESTFNFTHINTSCEEPVNFAYLQTNGVPAGPPSPQLSDVSSLLGNENTLKINPGDVLKVSMSDPAAGFTTTVRDLTTGQTGYMVASAANGFMNTNIADCSGTPFTFHAEYSSAAQQNQVPWAALEGGVLMQQELGHFETCNSVTNQDGFSVTDPNGQSYSDPNVYQTCVGGSEGSAATGEGPCTATLGCTNATTEGPTGPQACSTTNPASGALCEFADGYCFPKGSRPVVINGVAAKETWPVAGCTQSQFQNGDLDFDGIPYQPGSWPNGTANQPTVTEYAGPFQANGKPYPTVQFQTDVGGSESLCTPSTGVGCTAPPGGANFYPFYSLTSAQHLGRSGCTWNFGNVIPGVTTQTFGKDAQYGTPDIARYGGTIISAPMTNPAISGACARR